MNTVDVTIIICTYNRFESLLYTLMAINNLEIPTGLTVELLIVDNGSTDETPDVLEKMQFKHLAARYICESRRGLSYARNLGIKNAKGGILLFTDDDVRPASNWIEGMCSRIIDGTAEAVQGGICLPPHLVRPWQTGFLGNCIARTTQRGERPLVKSEQLVGANMAIARHVLERVQEFDVELGAGALGFGEESLFSWQLSVADTRLYGVWDVCVEHHFDAHRLTEDAFVTSAAASGRSLAYIQYHWEHLDYRFVGVRLKWLQFKSVCRQLIGRRSVDEAIGPRPWLVCYEKEIAFLKQYIKERRRPRNYSQFGLKKLHGILDERASSESMHPAEVSSGSG